MKKVISALLALTLVFAAAIPAFSVESGERRLLNIYGNNMIFQQNQPVVLNGFCASGASVSAELYDSSGSVVTGGKGIASKSGTFSVSFIAPKGGFENYTIKVYENKELLAQLNNVAFGEVWLASGQSNMQYPLAQDKTGSIMLRENRTFSPWLRIFRCEGFTKYHGSDTDIPFEPQTEIEGCFWSTGTDYGISAVGYWFAAKLIEELNMPVGVINASLGGSSIDSWLPREAIENNEAVKQDLIEGGNYYTYDTWQTINHQQTFDMSANFNLKINPLSPFTFAGIIWYQGETDCMFNFKQGRYSRAVDMLQSTWSKMFAPEGSTLPFIFTTLASCNYGDTRTMYDMNLEFADIQQAKPESRALVSIYDVPLDFFEEVGFIHPSTKQPVGERMAHCAMGLVYGRDDTYTSATVSSVKTDGSCVYITFRNTGKGLACDGILSGFSVCGDDGIYMPADAEIFSADTIKVSADGIDSPASVAYAYSFSTGGCNLFARTDDGFRMPVAAFVTEKIDGAKYVNYIGWTDCENAEEMRVIYPMDMSGIYEAWTVKNGSISFEESSAVSGNKGIHLTSDKRAATLSPFFNYRRYNRDYICSDIETDYSSYDTISVMVRNNGNKPASISSLKIYTTDLVWYSPVSENGSFTADIPADGQWHKVTFNLNSLKLWGRQSASAYGNEKLTNVRYLKINISAEDELDLSFDEVRFTSDGGITAEIQKTVFYPFDLVKDLLCKILILIDGLIYR